MKEARRKRAESNVAPTSRPPPEPSWDELQPLIDSAIEALPDAVRVPLIEHFLEGRTQEEIGRDLGVSREAVVDHARGLYRGEVEYGDAALGELVATLREEGLLERTLLVVTADHGEEFGDHGHIFHKLRVRKVGQRGQLDDVQVQRAQYIGVAQMLG